MLVHVKHTVGTFLFHVLTQRTILVEKLYYLYYTASEKFLNIENELREVREEIHAGGPLWVRPGSLVTILSSNSRTHSCGYIYLGRLGNVVV